MTLFRSRNLSLFYQQLGQLYKSGVPVSQSLPLAAEHSGDTAIREATERVYADVMGGKTLGSAVARQPQVFTELQAALIAVGEENGRLDSNLFQLSTMYEKQYKNQLRFLLAMLYPSFLFLAALFVPKIPIWWNGSFGEYLSAVFWTAVPFLAIGVALYVGCVLSQGVFIDVYDQVRLKIPVLGKSLHKMALARFSRCLATLYSAGIDMRRCLQLSTSSFENTYLKRKSQIILGYLEEGFGLAKGFEAAGVFPKEYVHIIALGEQTGDLDRVLEQTARMYEEESEKVLKAVLFFFPIAMYVLVAIYIASIVIEFYAGYYGNIGKIVP